ncbi:MAG: hypothetical protein JW832_04115 [Deltaproteobacteria bacterium]|nr:hypothetical protein [Deltaproteobacteria bacterium]
MKRKWFFQVFLSVMFVGLVVFLCGTVWAAEQSPSMIGKEAVVDNPQPDGAFQKDVAAPEKKTTERKSGYSSGSSSRISNFPEYEDADASESYGTPYWGYMRDN